VIMMMTPPLLLLPNNSLARRHILGKCDIAVDPIVHLMHAHVVEGRPMSVAMLEWEHCRTIEAMAWEANHLATRWGTGRAW
jgi:hypothetical protein